MEEVTGLHRKSLIRLMNSPICKALDYPSAERLKGQLVSTAEILARHGEIQG